VEIMVRVTHKYKCCVCVCVCVRVVGIGRQKSLAHDGDPSDVKDLV
jgi:hypothetical protein